MLVRSALVFSLWIVAVMAAAQDRTLTVAGHGVAEATPDMAVVDVGVRGQGPRAADALRLTSETMAVLMDTLDAAGIAAPDIQTRDISLSPVWSRQPGPDDGPPAITGFAAGNMLSIKLRDIDGLGALLDALAEAGANEIQSVRFAFQDPAGLMETARRRAVADAMARAAVYAEASGSQLGSILSIAEGGSAAPSPGVRNFARAEAMSVPVAAGSLAVSADVTLVFSLE